ncbi:DNA-binding response regulator [Bacillus velezensis]
MGKTLVCSENSYFQAYMNHLLTPDSNEIINVNTLDELKQIISEENFSSVIIDTCHPNDLVLQLIKSISCPVIILNSLETNVSDYNPGPILNQINNVSTLKHNVFQLSFTTFFDVGKHCIWKKNEYIPLAIQEFKILYLLYLNSNKIVCSEELIEYADLTGRSSLYVHISSLREKVEDNPGDPKILQTKFGKGYLLSDSTYICLEKKADSKNVV